MSTFQRGDQVAYIPHHADSMDHHAVEFGFVTDVLSADAIWVRYWRKGSYDDGLILDNSSKLTKTENLISHKIKPQEEIIALLDR